ncbi:hypothetical protein GYMLUDRAFT_43273 [Collybiopsis luxurians FD-317 M1]|uniref:Uncharacterized protein n=1 Tax=Collybiopsis luxurians FD-317 M1 TaxID=944289 RepID=A0A0D0BZ93_9AGAR|nr:hypothetical protein GYMLUDRAFT_43273 [Collybiopsis luxurians FD-317 M1]
MSSANQIVPHIPPIPPSNSGVSQSIQRASQVLQSIVDRFVDNRISADTARQAITWYFTVKLAGSPEGAIRPWLELVDDHERRMGQARQLGAAQNVGLRTRPVTTQNLLDGPDGLVGGRRSGENVSQRSRRGNSSEEEDDEGNLLIRSTKRAKQDPSQFGWAAASLIHLSTLPQRHRNVIAAVQNYSVNIDAAIENIEASCCNPIFPRELWKTVLKDEYVELTEVFALVSAYHSTDASRPVKEIQNEVDWRCAWRATADATAFAFPGRKRELEKYEKHIQGLFDNHIEGVHRNILLYDRALRVFIGLRSGILYDDFDHRDCPDFRTIYLSPTGVWFQQPSVTSSSRLSVRARKKSKEVCRRYNHTSCTGCDRKHICSICSRPGHGAHSCPSDKSEKSRGKQN